MERLKKNILELGSIGKTLQGGVDRATGTKKDKDARDLIVSLMKEAELDVQIDKIGNIFGRREGNSNKKVVMVGSHIDSVPNGGVFDGSLGVLMSLEAVRVIEEECFKNERPIEVVVFSDEEGHFHPHLGSKVLAGILSIDVAGKMLDNRGISVESYLADIGYKGCIERSIEEVESYIEPHVEQGPVLYDGQIPLGIVRNVVGLSWLNLVIQGEENHAGATPMNMRKDALVSASEIALFVHRRARQLAQEYDSSFVGTAGRISVFPNAINVIPGKVKIGIDVRSVVHGNIERFKEEICEKISEVEQEYGVKIETEEIGLVKPVAFSNYIINRIKKECAKLKIAYKIMNSGGGHDAQEIAQKTKAGMMFLPSVNGVSHSPKERTEWKDIELGTKVLTQTLKHLSE